MSGFDAGWLALREPFDAAARDGALARCFISAVVARASMRTTGSTPDAASPVGTAPTAWRPGAARMVDLAAGAGANLRVLAPQIPGDQDWLLVDHDPQLIAAQAGALGRWAGAQGWHCSAAAGGLLIDTGRAQWRVRARRLDLQTSFDQLHLGSFDGVTTTAFLDLVSDAWLERLADRVAAAALPLLATLTVDGRREWQPPADGDAAIAAAFERHQRGDKGFGASVGPAAAAALLAKLDARGYRTQSARSDWRIEAGQDGMLLRMVDECAAVADSTLSAEGALVDPVNQWAMLRRRQAAAGTLTLQVGHRDVVALPA
ncbi:MAG: hypothetical protein ING77_12565 [Rhodocyclaceae bacterium]|jgi:hypothetical protein|nr:hypothetical protein [Rhodocyclaceae bacterium]MCA3076098.1 hypothetical protein [Rhodocyclaceae bacterium]MCA3089998.1 hypothetical protein [Rhodocyclaceae bacterium]MCA3093646.1 hypothetical protein [Rhodocyclaceae bacterium]MCA3099489.1 hypothetical protein [Rhodocyclaceae bacterium]